jgi:hypothetical protein
MSSPSSAPSSLSASGREPRIRIFVGAYGSGKTEVAINYTLGLKERGGAIAIADLDLVNPYFRSRELREAFEARGIHVVAPEGALSQADLPIITPDVRGFIENPEVTLVLDVGGDDAGARALSQFKALIEHEVDGYAMYFVVNDRRPWTGSVAGLRDTIQRVTEASRLSVSAIVSNPNLGAETSLEVVREGHAFIVAAARELGLPVAFLAVLDRIANELLPEDLFNVPVVLLERHLFPPWDVGLQGPTLRHAPYTDPRARILVREMDELAREKETRLQTPNLSPEKRR